MLGFFPGHGPVEVLQRGQEEAEIIHEELVDWIDEVKADASATLKTIKAEVAAGILEGASAVFGEERPDAFAGLRLHGGPKKSDQIAVIGAGAAGVSLAFQLVQKGYANVRILEKSERIGGKSLTLNHTHGVTHEMGTCYMSVDYEEVSELLRAVEYPFGEDSVVGRTIYDPDAPTRSEGIAFDVWLNDQIRLEMGRPKMSNMAVALRLLKDSVRYVMHHRRIFGKYELSGYLPARPKKEVLESELNCTIREFLQKRHLRSLVPIFKLAYTLQGYGHVERTPAVYGLMWVTPQLLTSLVEQLKVRKNFKGKHSEPASDSSEKSITVLRAGFQWLWEALVKKAKLRVDFNVDITSIRRGEDNITLTYKSSVGESAEKSETFDFLIIAVPLQNLVPKLDASAEEKAAAEKLHWSTFVTTLFDYKEVSPGHRAVETWFSNVHPERPLSVWTVRDALKLRRENGVANLPTPETGSSQVAYQFADFHAENISDRMIAEEFDKHFDKHELQEVTIVKRYRWPYFDRFPLSSIAADGYPWAILDMQGKRRTWYAGGWTSFEAVNAIASYSKRLAQAWEDQQSRQ